MTTNSVIYLHTMLQIIPDTIRNKDLQKEDPGKKCNSKDGRRMGYKLHDKILEAFQVRSKDYSDRTKDGVWVEYKAITFGNIHRYVKEVCSGVDEKYLRPREIKRQVIELVNEKTIVGVDGEPPVYMLLEEYDKFKSLSDKAR